MTDIVLPRRPLFEISGFRFRLWPIVLAAVLMQACLIPGRELARFIFKSGGPAWTEHVGLFVFTAIMFQALTALAGILIMRRVLPQADANLRWPPARSYVGLAIVVGIGMGLIMLVADYWPDLLRGSVPDSGYSLQPAIAAGWLLAMISTGLAEETLFRGLLVGMLVVLTPGRVRLGPIDLPMAGVIVAVLFGLAHYDSFLHGPLHEAVAQQTYAFVWGVTYVWLTERSRSLLAPIVAHGVGNFVEVALVMALTAALS